MKRDEALVAVKERIKNKNLVKHMLATEAVMRALARRLNRDEEKWGLAGLLHDIDLELTGGDMTRHSRMSAEIVRELGAGEEIAHAILAHNEVHGTPLESEMDKALFCADPLTGLIIAAALVLPDKKLASLETKSVLRRFKEKGFAAGASREQMSKCSLLGLGLDEFIEIGVKALKDIAPELGL